MVLGIYLIKNKVWQSAGGFGKAKKILDKYLKNPNKCLYCEKPILPRNSKYGELTHTKHKKFCDRSCAARFNSKKRYSDLSLRIKPTSTFVESGSCKKCFSEIFYKKRKNGRFYYRNFCENCVVDAVLEKRDKKKISTLTKGELFTKSLNWQSARSRIAKNARKEFLNSGKPFICVICSYSNHVDIAHIKPVSEFSDDSLIRDINCVDNLITLCPNHHWEFDNKLFSIFVI